MDIIDHQISFIVKGLVISTVISIVIKYGEEQVAIAPTLFNAIMSIVTLPLLMTCTLVWRLKNQPSIDPSIDKDSIR
ncbi:MAG: hypothetical protein ACQJCO_06395 [cyanobacterium endosymbiont of Rhopalodia sterrenbergii]